MLALGSRRRWRAAAQRRTRDAAPTEHREPEVQHCIQHTRHQPCGLQTEEKHHKTESVRLVYSRCNGKLEVNKGDWKPADSSYFTLKDAAVVCRELDCGSAVSVTRVRGSPKSLWKIKSECLQSGSALTECVTFGSSSHILGIICSVSFQGHMQSGRETSLWTKEFQCAGYESALLDCRSSGSTRNTFSPGKAVGLTCSEPVRLVGGQSRCAGTLEVKQGEWRPVRFFYIDWTLREMTAACKELDCGSAVFLQMTKQTSGRPVWAVRSDWVQSGSALRECVTLSSFSTILELICSDVLVQPNITVSTSLHGVPVAQRVFSGSNFTISCSTRPQYPGGTFLLTSSDAARSHSYTQPAVNHSARFSFPAAEPGHEGNYSCVYLFSLSQSFPVIL